MHHVTRNYTDVHECVPSYTNAHHCAPFAMRCIERRHDVWRDGMTALQRMMRTKPQTSDGGWGAMDGEESDRKGCIHSKDPKRKRKGPTDEVGPREEEKKEEERFSYEILRKSLQLAFVRR